MTTFAARDGTRLAFRDDGPRDAPVVLCLAGLTRDMADFDALAPHLPGYRMVRMDYRGRGASGWSGAASYNVAQEAADALALLDHLAIPHTHLIGTSRGGLVGMVLAATAPARLSGLCLNDIGPVIERAGLERIGAYVGVNPKLRTHADMAAVLPRMPGFRNVPAARWLEEAQRLWHEGPDGLTIRYDPALGEAFRAGMEAPAPDLWPLFDACAGRPLAVLRGAGSDILSAATLAEMQRRHPALMAAEIPDRGHVPFLDEPASLALIRAWLVGTPP